MVSMSMDVNGKCIEAANNDQLNDFPYNVNLSKSGVSNSECTDDEDEDEDLDLDFNPLLNDSPSIEAPSSLSSDSDKSTDSLDTDISSKTLGNEYAQENDYDMKLKRRKLAIVSDSDPGTLIEHVNSLSSWIDAGKDVTGEGTSRCQKLFDSNDENAICKRTRARYSLASFKLEELEIFLHEKDDDDDDEDDIQNVDDEEEYRKFLASVLPGGEENVDDEDEENDSDFELELEEALESDLDENTRHGLEEELKHSCGGPETRQNKHKKAVDLGTNKHLGHVNRTLRPLLPSAPITSFPVYVPSSEHSGAINGFTPYQLGQLHCLVYEHVQLLIQVYCLSISEPSQQHIASQIQYLISEMLNRRDQATDQRRNWHASGTMQSPGASPIEKRQFSSNRQEIETQIIDINFPLSSVTGPILSVLDVTPLSLVGKFMDDVTADMQEYQQRSIQATCDNPVERDPLFPFHIHPSSQTDTEVPKGTIAQTTKAPSSFHDYPPKKTLATTLVERSKKQSIALVPKSIAKLAQRFYPLFNSALFPHKPPPPSVANRVVFTDAEDELLALGLMEFNTDWKAIQQRFLPCKSKHQIFIRQKNRASSKAPENPIKEVRRLKNSPLTMEEIARIQEGLKVFKLDWMSVWKFVVPYRDPSLLPRQWRIANGTQKSYKATADEKLKRRIYDFNRKNYKPTLASWQVPSGKYDCQTKASVVKNKSGDDNVVNKGEAYVHEAFLADWRPGSSIPLRSEVSSSNIMERNQQNHLLPEASSHHAFMSPRRWKHLNSNRVHRTKGNLVKLAPGLPPVNLPPSVRVMSQSSFTAKEVLAPKIVNQNSTSKEIIPTLPPGAVALQNNKPRDMNSRQSDLEMHPLFFQSNGDGRLPFSPSNSRNLETSFTFVNGKKTQLNLIKGKDWFDKSAVSSSANIFDFHPLLQKEDVTNNNLLVSNSTEVGQKSISVSSETLQAASAKFCDPNEQADINASGHGVTTENETENMFNKQNESQTAVPFPDKLDSGLHTVVTCDLNAPAYGSLPEIVMEQEELSDSDEETGENVEFECEEMDDSDDG
ncbi:uncharacterized protein LOC124920296 [Impatiens glandulifera]|uniref:uncharacterized protein LOC124920296 n=1 Tax=Impatiens glandulifera TaxID=253017 RepID=UPI001FB18F5F|nr:uncharacterized protein LOC124920296 [Impatiens glandulifera]XP_047316708.1 uncharacterized protein LOC124920296 [Impatiens glandulifera]